MRAVRHAPPLKGAADGNSRRQGARKVRGEGAGERSGRRSGRLSGRAGQRRDGQKSRRGGLAANERRVECAERRLSGAATAEK